MVSTTALMMAHTVWQHATHTESYALVAALLTTEWLLLAAFAISGRSRFLLLLALANGLGIATHMLAALVLPVDIIIVVWAVRTRRCSWGVALAAAGAWLIGTLPYSLLVLDMVRGTGSLGDTLRSALLGSSASDVLNTAMTTRNLLLSVGYVIYNFPGLTVPLALMGIREAWTGRMFARWLGRALLAEMMVFALFVFRYPVVDQYAFFFPIYLILSLLGGIGLAGVLQRGTARMGRILVGLALLTAVWTPLVYTVTSSALATSGSFESLVGNKPYRDGWRAFFLPWGVGDHAARDLNTALCELCETDCVIVIDDTMMAHGVRYARAVGRLPDSVELIVRPANPTHEWDVALHAPLADAMAAERTVLLVPRDRDMAGGPVLGADWETPWRHLPPGSPRPAATQRTRNPVARVAAGDWPYSCSAAAFLRGWRRQSSRPEHWSIEAMHNEITPQQASELLAGSDGCRYLDVRTVEEYEAGHPTGALNIPVVEPDAQSGGMVPNPQFLRIVQATFDRTTRLVVGCKSGGRSAMAAQLLTEAGYESVSNMVGGFHGAHDGAGQLVQPGWSSLGLPIATGAVDGKSYQSLIGGA